MIYMVMEIVLCIIIENKLLMMMMNLIWFGYILDYPSGEEGGMLLPCISNVYYLPSLRLKGGGGSAPCGSPLSVSFY